MSAAGQQSSSRHEAACVPGSATRLASVAAAVDDALARGDAAALAACYAPDARHRAGSAAGDIIGREAVAARLVRWRRRHGDVEVLPTRCVADDTSVAWERIIVVTSPDAGGAASEITCATLVECAPDGTIVTQTDVWSPDGAFDGAFDGASDEAFDGDPGAGAG